MSESEIAAFTGPIAYGIAIFLGVVAGTVVNLVTQWWVARRAEKREVANLRFECVMNSRKIDRWLEELQRLRNAVNGDAIHQYFGWFDFDRFVVATANRMFLSGAMYRYLSDEEIGDLQVIAADLAQSGTNYMNNQIEAQKADFDKSKAVQNVDFWERKLKGHKATIDALAKRLEGGTKLVRRS